MRQRITITIQVDYEGDIEDLNIDLKTEVESQVTDGMLEFEGVKVVSNNVEVCGARPIQSFSTP